MIGVIKRQWQNSTIQEVTREVGRFVSVVSNFVLRTVEYKMYIDKVHLHCVICHIYATMHTDCRIPMCSLFPWKDTASEADPQTILSKHSISK